MSGRFKIFIGILLVVWAVLSWRVYYIAIESRTKYSDLANSNINKESIIAPIRGYIFDRHGKPLAVNDTGFALSIAPHLNSNDKTFEMKLEQIASLLPITKEEIIKQYEDKDSPYNHDFIPTVDFITYELAHRLFPIIEQNRDIFELLPTSRRRYPNGSTAAHIIGYIGKANTNDIEKNPISKYTGVIGKEGLERQYNDFLQGELGRRKTKVTAFNEEVEVLEEVQPTYNNHIQTSLDLSLQKTLDAAFKGQNGAAIVIDVENGEIIAAGSYPEYDINEFPSGISIEKWEALQEDPHKPLYNKMIYGAYPPGSVIKMGIGLAFLQFAGIDEHTVIPTPESIEVGSRKFRDWKTGGHGSADFFKSIKRSVDVYYYKLSLQVGIDNIANTLKLFGIGQKSGIDLPAEGAGILPTPEWKKKRYNLKWHIGDTINSSIGQGYMLTTPLQIARYTAAIASGKLVTPHLVTQKGDEQIMVETQDVFTPFQKSKLKAARIGMYQVCNEEGGTGYFRALKSKVRLACKTGTAQVTGIPQADKARIREEDMEYFHRSHAWFTAFVPYEQPKYAITVLIEHGMHGSWAGDTVVVLANALVDLGYIDEKFKKKRK
ncbi:penicillin-binding protein 2 [Helicobacter monodelphidis]|uniref:penicillin-binding protein 2 n=1 Tax=Helicobacter sp. 15-1451 TaxID=2004995 RepID=UPI000DCCCC54|nr:penicillin-binding protein 2 [Helicobacter sp. 15-1451]RAX58878.1 penicillin-binding protein 2 [Helicobacter sp. 15-1451]